MATETAILVPKVVRSLRGSEFRAPIILPNRGEYQVRNVFLPQGWDNRSRVDRSWRDSAYLSTFLGDLYPHGDFQSSVSHDQRSGLITQASIGNPDNTATLTLTRSKDGRGFYKTEGISSMEDAIALSAVVFESLNDFRRKGNDPEYPYLRPAHTFGSATPRAEILNLVVPPHLQEVEDTLNDQDVAFFQEQAGIIARKFGVAPPSMDWRDENLVHIQTAMGYSMQRDRITHRFYSGYVDSLALSMVLFNTGAGYINFLISRGEKLRGELTDLQPSGVNSQDDFYAGELDGILADT